MSDTDKSRERKRRISISVTDDEYNVFKVYAASQTRSVATFARVSMIAEIRRRGQRHWYKKMLARKGLLETAHELVVSAEGDKYDQVYFVLDVDGPYIKIGYSRTPDKRFETMKTDNPHSLEFLFSFRGDRKTEKEIQRRFASIHHRNEWFHAADELYEFINALREEVGSLINHE